MLEFTLLGYYLRRFSFKMLVTLVQIINRKYETMSKKINNLKRTKKKKTEENKTLVTERVYIARHKPNDNRTKQ